MSGIFRDPPETSPVVRWALTPYSRPDYLSCALIKMIFACDLWKMIERLYPKTRGEDVGINITETCVKLAPLKRSIDILKSIYNFKVISTNLNFS